MTERVRLTAEQAVEKVSEAIESGADWIDVLRQYMESVEDDQPDQETVSDEQINFPPHTDMRFRKWIYEFNFELRGDKIVAIYKNPGNLLNLNDTVSFTIGHPSNTKIAVNGATFNLVKRLELISTAEETGSVRTLVKMYRMNMDLQIFNPDDYSPEKQ